MDCKVITVGKSSSADYSYTNVSFDEFGRGTYTLLKKGEAICEVSLGVVGEHNITNSLAVIALMDLLEVSMDISKASLKNFTGTDRRFEYKGDCNGFTIIDDYAHHPTEISATLRTARRYPHNKTWCIFQPHTYTRTKAFFDEFAEVLTIADNVVLADIFAARETDTLGVSSQALADAIREKGTPAYYFPTFEEIENFILENCVPGDLVITMGAGNIVTVGEDLLKP